jgi:xylulokinase
MPPIARTIDPDTTLTAAYDAGHARYRAAAAAIQKLSHP